MAVQETSSSLSEEEGLKPLDDEEGDPMFHLLSTSPPPLVPSQKMEGSRNPYQLIQNHKRAALIPCNIPSIHPCARGEQDCSGEICRIENGKVCGAENGCIENGKCRPPRGTMVNLGGLVNTLVTMSMEFPSELNNELGKDGKVRNFNREANRKSVSLPSEIDGDDRKKANEKGLLNLNVEDTGKTYHITQYISYEKPFSETSHIQDVFRDCHQSFPVHIIVLRSSYQTMLAQSELLSSNSRVAHLSTGSIPRHETTIDNGVVSVSSRLVYRSVANASHGVSVDRNSSCCEAAASNGTNSFNIKCLNHPERSRYNMETQHHGVDHKINHNSSDIVAKVSHFAPLVRCRTLLSEDQSFELSFPGPCEGGGRRRRVIPSEDNNPIPHPTSSPTPAILPLRPSELPPTPSNTTPIPPTTHHRSSPTRNVKLKMTPTYMWVLLLLLSGLHGRVGVRASEFPDRECCDSAPPPPPHYHTTTSTTPVPQPKASTSTIIPTLHSLLPTSSVPPTGEGALGVRNCLLARQQCADDTACRSVLEIIPRVCGPEDVACSTVTVDKCLAALRFLGGFPYFQPTCLCREPHLDRDCNVFREFIFDHPCMFVENKDKSPYQVHALPLCEYALNACEQLPGCISLYEKFREGCRVRDDQCKMDDTNECLTAWNKLKQSPMFGCVCPTEHQKRKCQRIFRIVHNNPCVGETSPSGPVPMLHSTCQTALVGCTDDQACRRLLDPVLAVCDSQCDRENCMSNLQTFYRNVDSKWAIEVAFCLCKKSSLTADVCLSAQEKLHPSCARKPAGKVPMLCNRLASVCKEDPGCRHRLEFYEQACAVDSDTRRCAGSTAECRRALLGILGTQLRNLCTCSAPDPRETYTCLDWQRILWFNPCVVEAQTDYHREMLAGTKEEITTTPNIIITPSVTTGVISEPVQQPNGGRIVWPVVIHPPASTTAIYAPTRWEPRPNPPMPRTIPITTTTTPAPTTIPPKYCEKRHTNGDTIDYIEEGWGKRFYKDEECSELCLCHSEEKLACSVLECVEPQACETNFAVYNHAAPAYQASRGECFCYSGSFICVRPPLDDYKVNDGVFLFLGYSKAEENLLRPYTKISLVDAALSKLSDLVRESAIVMNGRDRRVSSPDTRHIKTECHLELLTHVGENIILQATLEEFDYLRDNMTAEMLNKEKEECEESVGEVSRMINTHEKEVREDMALSVLILAEMQVHVPPLVAGAGIAHCPPLILLTTIALAVLVSTQHALLAS